MSLVSDGESGNSRIIASAMAIARRSCAQASPGRSSTIPRNPFHQTWTLCGMYNENRTANCHRHRRSDFIPSFLRKPFLQNQISYTRKEVGDLERTNYLVNFHLWSNCACMVLFSLNMQIDLFPIFMYVVHVESALVKCDGTGHDLCYATFNPYPLWDLLCLGQNFHPLLPIQISTIRPDTPKRGRLRKIYFIRGSKISEWTRLHCLIRFWIRNLFFHGRDIPPGTLGLGI